MIIYNGVRCETIEVLESLMIGLPEDQKQFLRNDFYKIPNEPIPSMPNLTPRQIRLALLGANIQLADVQAVIDSLPEPDKSYAQVSWDHSIEFERHDIMVDSIGAALGLTEEQIDAIFINGATL